MPERDGFAFPFGYRISAKVCHKAFRKAMYRLTMKPSDTRCLELKRCEEMYSKLAPGIERGDLGSIG